ncbi:hypothetical protein [Ornithinimicrobium sp. INDO-MA30-4]|uniref:hypothetical protein n=1 Tax=Ornithinimicrobium sp. INDO-MA30-4 TaxID=2908651 RepID=UPI001F1ADFC1|nr:hypothetical protein [Ornithinimicrobium sp. INDO-MA30-4]UJH70073.1 hypothetical protein L0A91_12830 [Ornithinimicrobium sp. INDO-MA30-4]
MTILSIGVEKLLKLTFGVIALDEDHEWPSTKVMKRYSHSIGDLYATVLPKLEERGQRALTM